MDAKRQKQHLLPKGAGGGQRIARHRGPLGPCGCGTVPSAPGKEAGRDPAIDEYLAALGPLKCALLQKLRETIRAVVPEAEECISYRIPAFRFRGTVIAGFSATSSGCSYYPFSGTTLKTVAEDIEGYRRTKSALHFGPDQPLPKVLVRKLLKVRLAEV